VNRKQLLDALGPTPRSLSDLAAQFGVSRGDVEDALPHLVRSARAAGQRLVIVPARCRACDFTFDESRLSRPSRCPHCRGSSLYEPLVGLPATTGGREG
jgi:predicted Zn-ribbon and HTH transcriptional regulator